MTAVHVATDPAKADEIEAAWPTWGRGIPLTIVESPYRSLTRPLLQYLSELKRHEHAETVTVVLPEYVPDSIWQHLLHGQAAQFLKLSLLFTPGLRRHQRSGPPGARRRTRFPRATGTGAAHYPRIHR